MLTFISVTTQTHRAVRDYWWMIAALLLALHQNSVCLVMFMKLGALLLNSTWILKLVTMCIYVFIWVWLLQAIFHYIVENCNKMSPPPTGHMRPRTTLRAYLRLMAKQKRLMDGNSKKNAWEYFSKDLKKQTNSKQPFMVQFHWKISQRWKYIPIFCFTLTSRRREEDRPSGPCKQFYAGVKYAPWTRNYYKTHTHAQLRY